MSDCIFCRIASHDVPTDLVAETDDWMAFRDLNPVAPAHILVIPKRHIENLDGASEADKGLIGELLLASAEIARKEGIAGPGYRAVLNVNADGGQSVPHLHVHLLGGRRMGWPPG